jgi:hypothetical protein
LVRRRSLLLSCVALPLPIAAAVAQPWWDEKREAAEWERERDHERHLAEERHEHWEEQRAHAEWERRQRVVAEQEWARTHPH